MKKSFALVAALLLGCGGASSADQPAGAALCQLGTYRSCACDAGPQGTQTCASDGSGWGVCQCSGGPVIDAGKYDAKGDGAAACGDQTCEDSEDCTTCPADCGQCPTCDLAPSCTQGATLPLTSTSLASFDNAGQGQYVCGVDAGVPPSQTTCTDPQLKMRIKDIRINLNGVDNTLDMFCVVNASDGQSSALLVTPMQSGIGDHANAIPIDPTLGTFWGLTSGAPKLSQFNITITYQCFEVDSNSTWNAVLGAIAGASGGISAVPGNPYGWAFGLGSAAAAAAQAAVQAAGGNKLRLNVQQTIAADALLDLTNGRDWVIEQSGSVPTTFGSHNWDWALNVQSWGCATPRIGGGGSH